jgi:hypothetical protein
MSRDPAAAMLEALKKLCPAGTAIFGTASWLHDRPFHRMAMMCCRLAALAAVATVGPMTHRASRPAVLTASGSTGSLTRCQARPL